ncbi:hypothetical protein FKM82_007542 [Ascaphus truei]
MGSSISLLYEFVWCVRLEFSEKHFPHLGKKYIVNFDAIKNGFPKNIERNSFSFVYSLTYCKIRFWKKSISHIYGKHYFCSVRVVWC